MLYTQFIEVAVSPLWNESQLNQDEKALLKTVIAVAGTAGGRPVRLTDNFFEIGGNSLNAVTVVTKLRDQGIYLGAFSMLISKSVLVGDDIQAS